TINVQAGVAAHVSNDLPEQAATALQAIKDASRRGLRELRAILAVLRQADEAEPTHPAPGLDELEALLTTATAAGLPATIRIDGPNPPRPPPAALAPSRSVQESLPTPTRPAGPATATIRLTYEPHQLLVEVADTGTGGAPSSDGAGHGIAG